MTPTFRWLLGMLTILTIVLSVLTGCTRPAAPSAPLAAAPPVVSNAYVGNQACVECHPGEWNSYRHTGHAHTLHLMQRDALESQAPPVGPIPHTSLAIKSMNGRYIVRNPTTHRASRLDLAFGSGPQGVTYVAVVNNTTLFEMHYTYFPQAHRWLVTPGHEQGVSDSRSLGITVSGGISQGCILCHAVTLPPGSLQIDPKFMGVGCESCHGPGSKHIAAVQTPGSKDLFMLGLSTLGGKKMNDLCGTCHRSLEGVLMLPQNQRISQRFFPYALAMSRCFQQSNNRLSCSTCHNPHASPSKDPRFYEARCLQCHSPAPASQAQASDKRPLGTESVGKRVVCKVNPRSGCISCHMPQRKVFPGTSLPIMMADHWIRINHNER